MSIFIQKKLLRYVLQDIKASFNRSSHFKTILHINKRPKQSRLFVTFAFACPWRGVFPKTSVIQGSVPHKKKIKYKLKAPKVERFCIPCSPYVSKFVKHPGACRKFGNENLFVVNVACKICEQLRNRLGSKCILIDQIVSI